MSENEGEERLLELRMSDVELAAALLPEAGRAGGVGVPELAPSWPSAVTEKLSQWPLRGPGILVFDGNFFLDNIAELVSAGRGLLVFPGGLAALGLPIAGLPVTLRDSMKPGVGLAAQLLKAEAQIHEPIPYGDLLRASDGVASGVVDFSRGYQVADGRRRAVLEPQPFGGFGLEYVPRTWACGAVIRAMEPEGVADCAGCREGDVIVAADGESLLDAPLAQVRNVMAFAREPVALEIEQPLIERPFYLREATTRLLQELAGEGAENAAWELVPSIEAMMRARNAGGLVFEEQRPMVFAGDGGSSSRRHADQQHRVQFCHVLSGSKLFALDTRGGAGSDEDASAGGSAEVSLPVDQPLGEDLAAWLRSEEVSAALCQAGDIFCFWGGDRHCGANGMDALPCIALFHSCSKADATP